MGVGAAGGLLAWASLDHVAWNAAATGLGTPDLPWALEAMWRAGGSGSGAPVALAVLGVAALAVDTAVTGRGALALPRPPRLARMERAAARAAAAWRRAGNQAWRRAAAGALAAAGTLVGEVGGDLTTAFAPAEQRRAGLVAARLAWLRTRREAAHSAAADAAPLAVASPLALLCAGGLAVLVAMAAAAAALGAAPEPVFGANLAGQLARLADWWAGLSLVEQVVATLLLAALLSLAGLGFGAALTAASVASAAAAHGHLLAGLIRDPRTTVRQLTPGQAAMVALDVALLRGLPAGGGAAAGRAARVSVDDAISATKAAEFMRRRQAGLAASTDLLGRRPRNWMFAGFDKPLPADLAARHGPSIRFTHHGFPDFSPHARHTVTLDRFRGRAADFRAANQQAGLAETPSGWTWHHVEDGRTMHLVPRDLHRHVGHDGGMAATRRGAR